MAPLISSREKNFNKSLVINWGLGTAVVGCGVEMDLQDA